jgi:hypothetical protein
MNVSQVLDLALKEKSKIGRPSARRWRGSLLGACVRQQWYNAEKVEPTNPFPDSLYRVFERGHVVAEVLNRAGREAERLGLLESFREEVPLVWDEYNFSGNADAVVLRKDGINEVWEYKSINSRGMQYLKGVKPEHAIQASIYAHILELQTGDPHEARVVYVAADNFQIVEYTLDRAWRDRAMRVLRVLQYFDKRMPPRLPSRRGKDMKAEWPCKGCQWLKECRG